MTDFESSSMRVSDADRESAMTVLGEHMSTGRLTVDEYGDRAARLSTAKTRADVLALFDDLPRPWPKFSGVEDEVVTPIPLTPKSAPVPRSRPGLGLAMIPLVPLAWVAAIVIALVTGHWAIFLLPILLTVFGAVLLGRGVHRLGRRVVANFTEATGWVGPEYREAMRGYRDTMRNARRGGWKGEMLGQIGAEIQRGMRERGAYNYRRHQHHGRRRDW